MHQLYRAHLSPCSIKKKYHTLNIKANNIKPQLGTMKEQKTSVFWHCMDSASTSHPSQGALLQQGLLPTPAAHPSWGTQAEPPGWHVTSCLPPRTLHSLSPTCDHPPVGPEHLLLPQARTRGPCFCLVSTTCTLYTSKPNCILLSAKNKSNLRPSLQYDSYMG